jgi:hypothetical protein
VLYHTPIKVALAADGTAMLTKTVILIPYVQKKPANMAGLEHDESNLC